MFDGKVGLLVWGHIIFDLVVQFCFRSKYKIASSMCFAGKLTEVLNITNTAAGTAFLSPINDVIWTLLKVFCFFPHNLPCGSNVVNVM